MKFLVVALVAFGILFSSHPAAVVAATAPGAGSPHHVSSTFTASMPLAQLRHVIDRHGARRRRGEYGAYPMHMLPLFLALIGVEALWIIARPKRAYPWHEVLATFGVVLLQFAGKLVQPALLVTILGMLWPHRLFTVALPAGVSTLVAFVGVEFAYYWMHRSSHRWSWLWATHSVHHSSEHMTFASALRLGVTGAVAGDWVFYVPLVLLGFQPPVVFGLLGLNLIYQFFLHTELVPKLGPLEWILNTPSHHRVHHASNEEFLDRNFGGVLIVFDRLFGTLAVEQDTTSLRYGLHAERRGLNPLRIAFGGWWALLTSLRTTLRPSRGASS